MGGEVGPGVGGSAWRAPLDALAGDGARSGLKVDPGGWLCACPDATQDKYSTADNNIVENLIIIWWADSN